MIRLTKKQVLMLHTQLIKETGGSDGIRNNGLLDSALESPFQSFGGDELYPSIQAKAARLCYGLVKNHAMIDGNKRIGVHVMLVFLAVNGYELEYTQKELSDVILDVANGKKGYEDILAWILKHQL
ncbi:type II toxin-antitoxin system death-on-curing family toxin [Parablautia muri]|uniref:Type II toxin-antitoxin system death-on-curing family toxin n=1 Tax=Parablautia muri TaxID=2320879 RepID=A0A9X5GV40_9FIRM|nr:type II toxin-antitoxin system death-on-curing family toxin [Parablautia muri]NBJ95485.1 type II toxin-antitoxin system death-on-curing family toxin [Parablautia muri]